MQQFLNVYKLKIKTIKVVVKVYFKVNKLQEMTRFIRLYIYKVLNLWLFFLSSSAVVKHQDHNI